MVGECDIIIAEAGASGCALAGRLSGDSKLIVFLVEAGSQSRRDLKRLSPARQMFRSIVESDAASETGVEHLNQERCSIIWGNLFGSS